MALNENGMEGLFCGESRCLEARQIMVDVGHEV